MSLTTTAVQCSPDPVCHQVLNTQFGDKPRQRQASQLAFSSQESSVSGNVSSPQTPARPANPKQGKRQQHDHALGRWTGYTNKRRSPTSTSVRAEGAAPTRQSTGQSGTYSPKTPPHGGLDRRRTNVAEGLPMHDSGTHICKVPVVCRGYPRSRSVRGDHLACHQQGRRTPPEIENR